MLSISPTIHNDLSRMTYHHDIAAVPGSSPHMTLSTGQVLLKTVWIDKGCKRTNNKSREGKERETCQGMRRVRVTETRAEALIREEGEIKEVLAAHFLSQTFSEGQTPR